MRSQIRELEEIIHTMQAEGKTPVEQSVALTMYDLAMVRFLHLNPYSSETNRTDYFTRQKEYAAQVTINRDNQ